MASRPLVLPNPFSGDQNWTEWIGHFEDVAAVNEWRDDDAKLQWLKVRLTGKAQTAFQRFPEDTRKSYVEAKKAMKARFEPQSRQERYKVEFQLRRRTKDESWLDFADNLKLLVDRAYPDLEDKAREQLALNHYLSQLSDQQVAFSVKQKRPATLDDAASATMEMESYLLTGKAMTAMGVVSLQEPEDSKPATVATVQGQGSDNSVVLRDIMVRLEEIEKKISTTQQKKNPQGSPTPNKCPLICWNCREPGHPARLCRRGTPSYAERQKKPSVNALRSASAARYSLSCKINDYPVSLVVDTGAAVSLVSDRILGHCSSGGVCTLDTWDAEQVVGVDGSPLTVVGRTHQGLVVDSQYFLTPLLVVESLTVDGILGIDFLREHHCVIDIPRAILQFTQLGVKVQLHDREQTTTPTVSLVETHCVPSCSEMEIQAAVSPLLTEGDWLTESNMSVDSPVAVARAIVHPKGGQIPVRILNTSKEAVTLYKGTKLGILEKPLEVATASVTRANAAKNVIEEMVSTCSEELTVAERDKLHRLLTRYRDIFMTPGSEPGRTDKLTHSIDTGQSRPVRQAVRRVSPSQRQEIKELLDDMLDKNVIQPSASPWASPIVLVKKKDGSTRFCVDYRKVNQVTSKDAFPLPRVDDTLDYLSGSLWFSTLDLASGYWQVEVDPKDRPKTAFCTPEGLFEFNVMPFGLCNAPATFQRLMNLILGGLQLSSCLVYLDDIIVMGRSFDEHLRNLATVFDRIQEAGLKLKPAKCQFLQDQVQYLGHIVTREGIAADPSKTAVIKEWPVPTCTKECFLGSSVFWVQPFKCRVLS